MFYECFIQLCELNNEKPTIVLKNISISPSNLQKWRDGATVNSSILVKLSEHFGVSVDYLLGRTDDPNNTQQANTITGNNNTNNTMTCKTVTQPQLDETTGELVTVFKGLKFSDKAKVMNLVAELSEKKGA